MADASKIIMTGGDPPETPLLGTAVIYFKTDGRLYTKDDGGEETEVGTGSGIKYINITSNTNANVNIGYLIDATNNAVTLTLPTTPSTGDSIAIVDSYNKATTNTITIARNGSKIESLEEDLVLDINGSGFTLTYVDATIGWKIVSEISGGGDSSSILATSITNGDTTHAPDGNSVFDALALKSDSNHTHESILTTSITNGDITHAPDGNSVYDALALKSDTNHTHSGYATQADLIALSIALGG